MENRLETSAIVFIVDDDADVRSGLAVLLDSVGLRSASFASTAEFLKSGLPDETSCLILDVRLPGAGGLDLQAELAAANIHIPVIFITGHADIPMTVKAMRAGAVEFLTKPMREQDVLDAVRIALDRDRERRQREGETRELRARFETLSGREQEILALVTAGLMNKQVAAEIGLSEITVKMHRHNIVKKLGARSLADLVRIADAVALRRVEFR